MKKWMMLLGIAALFLACSQVQKKPRVFVFTDINIDSGDPDDRQSLVHLLWYADELQIEGIVPDRWNASGYEACELAVNAYAKDYEIEGLQKHGYPPPDTVRNRIARDYDEAKLLFHEAACKGPLYVLIWGNMARFRDALMEKPELAQNIRLLTIATGVMQEQHIPHLPADWKKSNPCQQMNWNAKGRNDIYDDSRFDQMWWVEMNWSYEGMFTGPEPADMLNKLSVYGAMGRHLKEVVKKEAWAQYFRVGDTPTVLYLIDTDHEPNHPQTSSWAGQFCKPFPKSRPNYYTDFSDTLAWDYANPCRTWNIHEQVKDVSAKTLEDRRDEMYEALLQKLSRIYQIPKE